MRGWNELLAAVRRYRTAVTQLNAFEEQHKDDPRAFQLHPEPGQDSTYALLFDEWWFAQLDAPWWARKVWRC